MRISFSLSSELTVNGSNISSEQEGKFGHLVAFTDYQITKNSTFYLRQLNMILTKYIDFT